LKTSKSTNHNDSCSKSVPESIKSNFLIDLTYLSSNGCIAPSLVDDGDHGVSRVGHNGAEDTSPVPRQEGNHQLSALRVRTLLLCEQVLIESFDSVLKGSELDHGVGDLSHPERGDALVEAVDSLGAQDLVEAGSETPGESTVVSSLHSHFQSFHWTEEYVGDDFCAGGGAEEAHGLVLRSLVSESALVHVFEDLVEPELPKALH